MFHGLSVQKQARDFHTPNESAESWFNIIDLNPKKGQWILWKHVVFACNWAEHSLDLKWETRFEGYCQCFAVPRNHCNRHAMVLPRIKLLTKEQLQLRLTKISFNLDCLFLVLSFGFAFDCPEVLKPVLFYICRNMILPLVAFPACIIKKWRKMRKGNKIMT